MTPEERELAKKRALAKARARMRAQEAPAMAEPQPNEIQNGNTRQGQQAPQGQLDQLKFFGQLDSTVNKGNSGRATTALMQAANSSTLGGLDSLAAGSERLLPGTSDLSPGQLRRGLEKNHPASAAIGEAAGFIAPGGAAYNLPIQLGKQLPKLPGKALPYMQRLTGMAIGGGAANAAYQGTVGASNEAADTGQPVTLPRRAEMTAKGAVEPMALAAGPIASGLYRGGRGLITGKVTPKFLQPGSNAPSVDAIRDMKNEAYKVSDEMGVTYTADGFQNLVASIENKLQSLGMDPVLHQRPARMLKVIQDRVGSDKTLQQIDDIRKIVRRDVVSSAPRDGGDAERMFGDVIIDEIDNFIQAGQNVSVGNGPEAANAIIKARQLNTVYRKSQALEDAVERASNRAATTGSGGNFENALRQEIRKIYENPKKSAGFNKAEKAAMKKVIDGDGVQNLLRNIGKLSPQGNGLMAAIGVGSSAANPLLAPVFLGGIAAKHMAQKGIRNKFDDLDALVRSGAQQPPMKNITPPKSSDGTQAVADALMKSKNPQAGFAGAEMLGGVGGAGAGGAYGSANPTDFNEDGEVSTVERLRSMGQGAAIGGALGIGGAKGAKAYARGLDDSVSRSVRTTRPESARPKPVRMFDRMANEDDLERAIRSGYDSDNVSYQMLVGQDDLTVAVELEGRIRDNLIAQGLRPDEALKSWRQKYLRKDIRDQMPTIEATPRTQATQTQFKADSRPVAANDASSTQFDNVSSLPDRLPDDFGGLIIGGPTPKGAQDTLKRLTQEQAKNERTMKKIGKSVNRQMKDFETRPSPSDLPKRSAAREEQAGEAAFAAAVGGPLIAGGIGAHVYDQHKSKHARQRPNFDAAIESSYQAAMKRPNDQRPRDQRQVLIELKTQSEARYQDLASRGVPGYMLQERNRLENALVRRIASGEGAGVQMRALQEYDAKLDQALATTPGSAR